MLFRNVGMERKNCNLFLSVKLVLSDGGTSDEEGTKEEHTSRSVKRTMRWSYSGMEICSTDAQWKRDMLSTGEGNPRS